MRLLLLACLALMHHTVRAEWSDSACWIQVLRGADTTLRDSLLVSVPMSAQTTYLATSLLLDGDRIEGLDSRFVSGDYGGWVESDGSSAWVLLDRSFSNTTIETYSLADPEDIQHTGSLSVEGNVTDMRLVGDWLCVLWSSTLRVYDVSVDGLPQLLAEHDDLGSGHLDLSEEYVLHHPGSGGNASRILDTGELENVADLPAELTIVRAAFDGMRYAFYASNGPSGSGLYVYEEGQLLAHQVLPSTPTSLQLDGDVLAYTTSAGLHLSSLHGGQLHDGGVSRFFEDTVILRRMRDGYLFASWESFFNDYWTCVARVGNGSWQSLSADPLLETGADARMLRIGEASFALGSSEGSLQLLQAGEGDSLLTLAQIEETDSGIPIWASDTLLAVSQGTYGGLDMISISEPELPVVLYHLDSPDTPAEMAHYGGQLFLADDGPGANWASGLHHFDVSDPSDPGYVQNLISGNSCSMVAQWGHWLAAESKPRTNGPNIRLYDLSDPGEPAYTSNSGTIVYFTKDLLFEEGLLAVLEYRYLSIYSIPEMDRLHRVWAAPNALALQHWRGKLLVSAEEDDSDGCLYLYDLASDSYPYLEGMARVPGLHQAMVLDDSRLLLLTGEGPALELSMHDEGNWNRDPRLSLSLQGTRVALTLEGCFTGDAYVLLYSPIGQDNWQELASGISEGWFPVELDVPRNSLPSRTRFKALVTAGQR